MRSCYPSTFVEPLERRQLLAAAVNGLFSGSVIFDGTQHHAVLNVSQGADSGLVSGSFRVDDLGRYTFSGSATNGVLSLIFNGARGSGAIVAKIADNTVSGAISGSIDGSTVSGSARLHGPASSSGTASGTAAVLIDSADISNTTSGIDAVISGSVQFRGAGLGPVGGGTPTGSATLDRRHVHAVVHIDDTSTAGLFTGSFRMDRVGRFRFNGSVDANGTATIVFANGAGSGTIVADAGDLITSGSLAGGGGGLSGKIFANIGGTEVHGIVRMNVTSVGGTSAASGQSITGAPLLTPPVALPTPPTSPGTGAGSGLGASIGSVDTSTGSGNVIANPTNPFTTTTTPTGNGPGSAGTSMGDLFGDMTIGGGMFP